MAKTRATLVRHIARRLWMNFSVVLMLLVHADQLGSSSNIAFMRHIVRAISDKLSFQHRDGTFRNEQGGSIEDVVFSATKPPSPSSLPELSRTHLHESAVNVLPPHQETELLIEAYFRNTGLLFPYIDQEGFLETYHHLKSQRFAAEIRRTWLGLLNMVLAMARCTADFTEIDQEVCLTPADVFYHRAKELCKTQMLRGTTLETGTSGSQSPERRRG